MKAMMMQIQIFIPVVFAFKCGVSTNLTYIYTDFLYLQSIKFAYSTKCRHGVNPFVCIIVSQMLSRLQIKTFARVLFMFC